MRVGLKTQLAPVSVMALWLLSGMAVAGDKGCLTCSPPPPPPTPPVPPYSGCVGSCTPVTPPVVCCGGGSVNVNVNINHAGASANASSNASAIAEARARAYGGARAGASSTVFVGGGGGAYFNVDQPYPMTANMAVEGSRSERVQRPYTSTRSWEKRYRLQAVCLDDRGVPHAASQVRPGKGVAEDYEGEVYRCIAGTKLQWTRTDLDGGEGQSVTCNKNEALWYGGKVLECRPQKRERDCHERSLLRRYGAGEKELVIRGEETITELREEVVEHSFSSSGSMMMDGGVGGRVF